MPIRVALAGNALDLPGITYDQAAISIAAGEQETAKWLVSESAIRIIDPIDLCRFFHRGLAHCAQWPNRNAPHQLP